MKTAIHLFVIALISIAAAAIAEPASKVQPAGTAQPGQLAPTWSRPDANGTPIDYPAVSAGTPSILFFWAGWCPYCRHLMPHLVQIEKDYQESGVRVYGIHIFDDKDPVAQLSGRGFDFLIIPQGDEIAAAYAVPGTPGLFLVDAKGTIAWRRKKTDSRPRAAASQWNDELRQAIDQLLSNSG